MWVTPSNTLDSSQLHQCSNFNVNWIKELLTGGLNSFIFATRPYSPTSFIGRRPSGVTRYISRRLTFATRRFKSVGDVKFPWKNYLWTLNMCIENLLLFLETSLVRILPSLILFKMVNRCKFYRRESLWSQNNPKTTSILQACVNATFNLEHFVTCEIDVCELLPSRTILSIEAIIHFAKFSRKSWAEP